MRPIDAKDMARVLGRIFGLPATADATTIARIKHLQRLGFPQAGKVGTGHRRGYGFAEALKICVAFQLADAGMSSALAAELLTREWATVAPALLSAATGNRAAPLIGIAPYALSPDAKRDPAAGPASRLISRSRASPKWPEQHRPVVQLDPIALVADLKRALLRLPGIAADEVDDAASVFSTSVGP